MACHSYYSTNYLISCEYYTHYTYNCAHIYAHERLFSSKCVNVLLVYDTVSMNKIKTHFSPWKWNWHRNEIKWSLVIKQSIHLKSALSENLCDEMILMGVVLCGSCCFYHAIYQHAKCIYKIINKNRHAIPNGFIAAMIWFNQTLFLFKTIVFNYTTLHTHTHTFYNRDILSLLIHIMTTGLIGIIISMRWPLLLQLLIKLFTFGFRFAGRAFYAISHNQKIR